MMTEIDWIMSNINKAMSSNDTLSANKLCESLLEVTGQFNSKSEKLIKVKNQTFVPAFPIGTALKLVPSFFQ